MYLRLEEIINWWDEKSPWPGLLVDLVLITLFASGESGLGFAMVMVVVWVWLQVIDEEKRRGELWSSLPSELQLSILSNLPVIDLVRLRLVSRHWQALLDTRIVWASKDTLTFGICSPGIQLAHINDALSYLQARGSHLRRLQLEVGEREREWAPIQSVVVYLEALSKALALHTVNGSLQSFVIAKFWVEGRPGESFSILWAALRQFLESQPSLVHLHTCLRPLYMCSELWVPTVPHLRSLTFCCFEYDRKRRLITPGLLHNLPSLNLVRLRPLPPGRQCTTIQGKPMFGLKPLTSVFGIVSDQGNTLEGQLTSITCKGNNCSSIFGKCKDEVWSWAPESYRRCRCDACTFGADYLGALP